MSSDSRHRIGSPVASTLPGAAAFIDFVIVLPHSNHSSLAPTAGPIVDFMPGLLETGLGALLVVVDERGQLCRWNRECELITGRTWREVAGHQATSTLFGSTAIDPAVDRFFSALPIETASSRIVQSVRTPDGDRRHVVWERRLVRDESGCRHCVLTGMEIGDPAIGLPESERHQGFLARAGQALASSLDYPETLRTVMRLATRDLADACVLELIETDDALRVHAEHRDVTKRPLMRRLCGRTSIRTSPVVCFPAVRAEESVLWNDIDPIELRAVVQDDDDARALACLPVRSLLAVPLRARGRRLGALTLFSERSERRFDERDLRTLEDFAHEAAFAMDNARLYRSAREAILTRDQVLETVAHDLRNPLNEIVLAVELLASSGAASAKLADRVRRSAERMQRLIRDLLDIEEIERGCLRLERCVTAPGVLVHEATEAARELADRRGVELRLSVPPDLPQVQVDPDRILQVLGNLLDNALKFTPTGGRIDVIASAHARSVGVRVVDTGSGIPLDQLSHVVDRFFHRRRSRGGGNGLGLAISRTLIEAHGGRIWASNVEPHGAAFCLTLPIAESTANARSRPVRR
jgi:PAS domain S-box-containing protein